MYTAELGPPHRQNTFYGFKAILKQYIHMQLND